MLSVVAYHRYNKMLGCLHGMDIGVKWDEVNLDTMHGKRRQVHFLKIIRKLNLPQNWI
jgi:hypothetical protein